MQIKPSLCGESYTDGTGHDYDKCYDRIAKRIEKLETDWYEARRALARAHKLQKQTWWHK